MGKPLTPGDYVRSHGKLLTFQEIERMVGGLIVADKSTQSKEVLQVVRVVCIGSNERTRGKRLVYDDGKSKGHYCLVDKIHIARRKNPARFFEL